MANEIQFYSKEIQIMRQSQQKMALDFCIQNEITPTMEELQRITNLFVECCIKPQDEELKKRIKGLDKWVNIKKNPNGI